MDDITQFARERRKQIAVLGRNRQLKQLGRRFFTACHKQRYSFNFDWLGLPIIQYPQDIVALQEIVWSVQPDLIIETGIARGGSLIFYASMLELLGRGEVVGVDIDIRAHNRKAIERHRLAKRIRLIEGSSVDSSVINQLKLISQRHRKILVCLDSNHSHDHVLRELEAYAPLVTRGSYLVAFDTVIEQLPASCCAGRPWGPGNSSGTAVKAFLRRHRNFMIDRAIEAKLIITAAPGGFLKRLR